MAADENGKPDTLDQGNPQSLGADILSSAAGNGVTVSEDDEAPGETMAEPGGEIAVLATDNENISTSGHDTSTRGKQNELVRAPGVCMTVDLRRLLEVPDRNRTLGLPPVGGLFWPSSLDEETRSAIQPKLRLENAVEGWDGSFAEWVMPCIVQSLMDEDVPFSWPRLRLNATGSGCAAGVGRMVAQHPRSLILMHIAGFVRAVCCVIRADQSCVSKIIVTKWCLTAREPDLIKKDLEGTQEIMADGSIVWTLPHWKWIMGINATTGGWFYYQPLGSVTSVRPGDYSIEGVEVWELGPVGVGTTVSTTDDLQATAWITYSEVKIMEARLRKDDMYTIFPANSDFNFSDEEIMERAQEMGLSAIKVRKEVVGSSDRSATIGRLIPSIGLEDATWVVANLVEHGVIFGEIELLLNATGLGCCHNLVQTIAGRLDTLIILQIEVREGPRRLVAYINGNKTLRDIMWCLERRLSNSQRFWVGSDGSMTWGLDRRQWTRRVNHESIHVDTAKGVGYVSDKGDIRPSFIRSERKDFKVRQVEVWQLK